MSKPPLIGPTKLLTEALGHLDRVLEQLQGHDAVQRHQIRREEAERFLRSVRRTQRATQPAAEPQTQAERKA